MASYQNSRIFSQGCDLSQLTGGFPSEQDSGTNEEGAGNVQENQIPHGQGETMSSRAEAICEENRQIHRFVELSLKQLEKKRIKLINKEKALDEEKAKLLETQKRQSEQSVELQMNIEEWSTRYANQLKERNNVAEKLTQVENFISTYEQNLAMGKSVGESIEESKQFFKSEFDNIKKKSKVIRENMTRNKASVTAELEEKAKKCKDLRDAMMKDREIMVGDIQNLALQNNEMVNRIKEIQKEIEKAAQNKEALTQSYNEISMDRKVLDESIAKMYQELNEAKTVNAFRIQHLRLQINTEENIKHNLETKLNEKESCIQMLTIRQKELTNLSNQLKEAVDGVTKRIEKKVKEIDLYKNKKTVLSDQASSLVETLKKYENVENENKRYKDSISSLEEEIKLNINILSEKENVVHELSIRGKELEGKLSKLKENKLELDRKLENLRTIEHKLTSSVKEDIILYRQEREKKIEENENLKQTNIELASEITECTLKLEELLSLNENSKEKEEEIRFSIESYKATVTVNEERFLKEEEEQIVLVEKYNEKIDEISNYLDRNDFFVLETKPKQKKLPTLLEKKELLEQEIKLLTENHQNKINTFENNHRSKIQGMDDEMEKHLSIMRNIQTDQEESTSKLNEEIKQEEKPKTVLENELRVLHQKLKSLKNEEVNQLFSRVADLEGGEGDDRPPMKMMKRNKIAKMEKRQQTIMKEIKVTHEDIAQAVAGKSQEPGPSKRARRMTPSSSAGSYHSLHGKVGQRMEGKENRPIQILPTSDSKQEITRKWIDSVPEEECDFSEV